MKFECLLLLLMLDVGGKGGWPEDTTSAETPGKPAVLLCSGAPNAKYVQGACSGRSGPRRALLCWYLCLWVTGGG